MNKERLTAFSDGVIAIIITIMVLELKVPLGATFTALAGLLPVHWLGFLAYVLLAYVLLAYVLLAYVLLAYVLLASLWLIPDRRIERAIAGS